MAHIFLWAIVGGVAGLIFGVTAGLPGRMVFFMVLLGAGAAAVPLVEAEVRGRRKSSASPRPMEAGPETREVLIERNGQALSTDEARQWLDDFLLKQQGK